MSEPRYQTTSTRFGRFLIILCILTCSASWGQNYEDGRKAYISGDYQLAYDILKPLADNGDSEAQKILGVMHDYGQGVDKDPAQALYWYRLSAEQGQPAVQYQVGAKYFRGDGIEKDYEEAAKWWDMSANGGQVDAQFNLGLMYYRGLAVDKDNMKASELFLKAAEQGHSYAQYSLAVMYSFGQGVEKNHETALHWFSQSAEQGIAQAQYNMGVYYENGYGIDSDIDIAKNWYTRASAQGLEEATNKLENLKSVSTIAGTIDNANIDPSEYSIAELSTDTGIRRETWVLSQNPKTYTLQISSVVSEDDLMNYIKQNGLESDVAYIEVEINGVKRYNALYGVYEDYDQAIYAVENLPENLRKVKPWIRNFSVLQDMIN